MSERWEPFFFTLPSVLAFFSGLEDSLRTGNSLLVLLPTYVPVSTMRDHLLDRLPDWWDFRSLDLSHYDASQVPAAFIGNELHLPWPDGGSRQLEDLVAAFGAATGPLPDSLDLRGFACLDAQSRQDWMKFFESWASRAFQSRQGRTGECKLPLLSLFVEATAVSQRPSSDKSFSLRAWWGFPSSLELQLYCRQRLGGLSDSAEGQWRQHVLPSLSSSDHGVIACIWDEVLKPPEVLQRALRSLALDRGWSDGCQVTHIAQLRSRPQPRVSAFDPVDPISADDGALYHLWANGIVVQTPEYGLELHAGWLALENRIDDLNYRLWRGQQALVLQLAEHTRLSICDEFSFAYGADWPKTFTDWQMGQDELTIGRRGSRGASWGLLEGILRDRPATLHLTHLNGYGLTAAQFRSARNEVAHYAPISFSSFQELVRLNRKHRFPLLLSQ